MIKRRAFLTTLALAAGAKAAEIRPAGGAINRTRISYEATYDADAQTYFTAVTANGGTMSAATKAAVNARVLAAKAHGIWAKWTRKNLFCGDNLSAALVPLKAVGGNATDTNNNFVGGDYSEVTGLTGNGTTKFLNTGLLANALAANDTHFAVYNRSSTDADCIVIGCDDGGGRFLFLGPWGDANAYSDQYSATTGRVSGAVTAPFGMLMGSRVNATDHKIYRNGTQIGTSATSGGALPALAIYVFAANSAGVAGLFSNYALAGYSVGSGLTGAESALDYTDEQAFQTALGRAVAP